jgi:hypothetical protein
VPSACQRTRYDCHVVQGTLFPPDAPRTYSGPTRVVNARFERPRDGVWVGRPSRWGNHCATLDEYARWLAHRFETDAEFRAATLALRGRALVCVCHPEPCHAHRIADLLNALPE